MKRSLSRGEKWLYWLSGVILLGLGGFACAWSYLGAEPDWTMPAPKPTPQPNGYDLYVAAGAAIIPAKPAVDKLNDNTSITDPKFMAQRYSLARRMAWLKQNSQVEKLFWRAKAADSLFSPDPRKASLYPYVALKNLVEYKVIESNTAKMRGDWNKAAQIGLDVIEMGGDIARGGPLYAYERGPDIEQQGIDTFSDTVKHLNLKQARWAARHLEDLVIKRPTIADAMREEKWFRLLQLQGILNSKNEDWRQQNWSGWDEINFKDTMSLYLLSKRQVVESYIRVCDWNIAHIQQPYSSSAPTAPESDNIINQTLIRKNSSVKFDSSVADTRISLLLLRLALRAYRVEKGFYPTTLTALAPHYLTEILRDPFTNDASMYYQKRGDNYSLWSIGRYASQPMRIHQGFGIPIEAFQTSP